MRPQRLRPALLLLALLPLAPASRAADDPRPPGSERYVFQNVALGGGGFVTGIVFNPTEKGLVYLRTDVGGAYRRDARSPRWVPLLDWAGQSDWNLYGVESLASDPVDPRRVYVAAGTYTNPAVSEGEILRSADYGATWARTPLPFRFGGNENGRNNGERLAVDPNADRVLFLGTRGAGLWRSGDFGVTWARIKSFPDYDEALPVPAHPGARQYIPQPVGINGVHFDARGGTAGRPTAVLYATVSTPNASVFRSRDGGRTWSAVPGQPLGFRPTRAALSSAGVLFVSYGLQAGPNSISDGAVWRCDTDSDSWTEVTPEKPSADAHFGYGSVAVDPQHPDTVLAGTWNHYTPMEQIFRSTDGGKTWTALLDGARWDHAQAPYTKSMNPHWMADVEIDPFDPGHALFTTGYGIWATRNLQDADSGKGVPFSFDDQGIEETVPLVLVSPPAGAHLLSGVGDIDGFRHDDLSVSPPLGRFGTPAFKNTASLAFAWQHPEVVVRSGNTYHNDLVTAGYSLDGATTWKAFAAEPPGTTGPFWRGEGPIAISPDGKTVVWSPTGVAAHFTQDWGASWFPCVGGSVNLAVAADTVNSSKFYAYDTEAGTIVFSNDGARSFKAMGGGLPVVKGRWGPAPGRLAAVPGREGEFWLIADGVLLHSINSGASVTVAAHVKAQLLGYGKAAPGRKEPTVFIVGVVAGVEGLFRSDDSGSTWIRINDALHGFGQMRTITGDPRIFGRVYFGTGGRGIVFGDIAR
ncbi:MAG TPA: xyloglucanase [Opitutaceae bacterium]